jgi:hypothetical protein
MWDRPDGRWHYAAMRRSAKYRVGFFDLDERCVALNEVSDLLRRLSRSVLAS